MCFRICIFPCAFIFRRKKNINLDNKIIIQRNLEHVLNIDYSKIFQCSVTIIKYNTKLRLKINSTKKRALLIYLFPEKNLSLKNEHCFQIIIMLKKILTFLLYWMFDMVEEDFLRNPTCNQFIIHLRLIFPVLNLCNIE